MGVKERLRSIEKRLQARLDTVTPEAGLEAGKLWVKHLEHTTEQDPEQGEGLSEIEADFVLSVFERVARMRQRKGLG
jgi:hypothetical protein